MFYDLEKRTPMYCVDNNRLGASLVYMLCPVCTNGGKGPTVAAARGFSTRAGQ